jgi:hypothetical protein
MKSISICRWVPLKIFRQRVVALNLWTSYSSPLKAQPDRTITDRLPVDAGSTLGGLWRLTFF